MTTLLTAKFAQVDASILDIQTQIASLQTKLTALQDYRQQLQSVEQACESALSQVDTALMMLHHVDASQVGTFKDAIDIKFATEVIGILEPADTTAEPTTPEPIATSSNSPIRPRKSLPQMPAYRSTCRWNISDRKGPPSKAGSASTRALRASTATGL